MTHTSRKGFRGLVLLMVVLSLALAACSSSTATTKPKDTPASSAVATEKSTPKAGESSAATDETTPEPTEKASQGDGSGLAGAVDKLSDIKSYKFTMTMKGGTYGSMLGDAPIKGTVVTEPKKAAYMSMMGMEIIEVDSKTYVKMGTSWIQSTDSSTSSLADDFAPSKMFGSYVSGSLADGYKPAGEEKKNGVTAIHYTADASILGDYGSMLGVEGQAKWSADVWVAKDGGYPVSVVIQATGGTTDFLFGMDITNVNDPANKVEAPI